MSGLSPRRAATLIRRHGSQLRKAAKDDVIDAANHGLRIALQQSSGTMSLAAMAAAGHPYATKWGSPLRALLPINKHEGEFYRGWYAGDIDGYGATWSASVINRAPAADFLEFGTRFMFARPITHFVEMHAGRRLAVTASWRIYRLDAL